MERRQYHRRVGRRAIVVGAGVMGAWTALWLRRRGRDVLLLDLYGPGNSLSSSGDESRIIRASHGPDAFYPRWVDRAWSQWRDVERRVGQPLLHEIGALWFAHREDGFEAASLATLRGLGMECERLARDEVARRYPVVAVDDVAFAVFEPRAGALMARRAVAAVADLFVSEGGELRIAAALRPTGSLDGSDGRDGSDRSDGSEGSDHELRSLRLSDGSTETADVFVFACGPWLRRFFPGVLSRTIRVTRQDVLYMAPPPGDPRFAAGRLPVWVDYDRSFYGIPSLEARGFKLAPDWLGEEVDPDRQERRIGDSSIAATRAFLAQRFPALATSPVSEGRVCQYESTSDAHFIIDRHPAWRNAWIVGGGSGHGFKHGPSIGEYASALAADDAAATAALAPPDRRFNLGDREPKFGLRTMATPPAE